MNDSGYTMKDRLSRYYHAVRSVRTSTWVLLVLAIGSNVLYYQVRPDPLVERPGSGSRPEVTVPGRDDWAPAPSSSVPPEESTTTSSTTTSVPDTSTSTEDTTTTSTEPPVTSVADEADPESTSSTQPGGTNPPGNVTQPSDTDSTAPQG